MRTFDAALLNEVANDPSIRHQLGWFKEGDMDLTPVISNINNYTYVNGKGGYICSQLSPVRFECHTIFRSDSDPRDIVRFMRECQVRLFTETSCMEIVTKVPDDNKGAGILAKRGGFVEIFHKGNAWKDGVGISYRSLPLDRWLAMCSTALEAGKAFHSLLEQAKAAKGSTLPVHLDDETHDRWVGAAVMMAKRGNVAKGVAIYNNWASFAGYAPVKLISSVPAVVDIHDAVVGVHADQMEVLLCR